MTSNKENVIRGEHMLSTFREQLRKGAEGSMMMDDAVTQAKLELGEVELFVNLKKKAEDAAQSAI